MIMRIGCVYAIHDVLSYFVGRVAEITPLEVRLETEEACWVRDVGDVNHAIRTGEVRQAIRLPGQVIERQAIRFYYPWPYPVPGEPLPAALLAALRSWASASWASESGAES